MSDERLTFTDAEMKEIDEDFSCAVKNNPEDAYDLVTRFCDMVCDEFQYDCPFQKLAQKLKFYEDAEEKGLLLRLPEQKSAEIVNTPTIEAEPVRHGEWLPDENFSLNRICSSCKKKIWVPTNYDGEILFNYCPNCGAKMKGANDE